jgi:hypothetical protein
MQMMVREQMREDEWRLTIVFDTAVPPSLKTQIAAAGLHSPERPGRSVEEETPSDGESTEAESNPFQEKFERAVVMAASLANHFILERADVEFITTQEERNVPAGSGHEHLYKILRSLATLQPTCRVEDEPDSARRRGSRSWGWFGRPTKDAQPARDASGAGMKTSSGIAWRLLDEVPVLRDDRRFKVLISSAAKGTIPAHVWRSAHVVFMDDL